jgi:hypothetical protein
MKTPFNRYWEDAGPEMNRQGITEAQAKVIFEHATNIIVSGLLFKASEFMTRPSTHPTNAVLEALNYVGITDDELVQRLKLKPGKKPFDAIKEDVSKQFEEAFPNLAKKS